MTEHNVTQVHRYCPTCIRNYEPMVEICPDDGNQLVRLQHHDGPLTGQRIDGKFVVLEILGRGGMGEVYRARQLPINREVALKVLHREFLRTPTDVMRFVREASAASRLKSRYAAMIHDFGISREGFIYLTMELAEGRLLSDHLDGSQPMSVERALHVGIDVCRALEEAHSQAIVHRDLKPANIMISEEDGHEFAKILDFGTAHMMDSLDDSRLTDEGKIFGTPDYMCPEQALGEETDGQADLYSLGIIFYEMLTGVLPFFGKTPTAVLLSHITRTARPMREVVPDQEIPGRLTALVAQLMAKRPKERPDSAWAVRIELEAILEEVAGKPLESHLRLFRTSDSTRAPGSDQRPARTRLPKTRPEPAVRTLNMHGVDLDAGLDESTLPTEEVTTLRRMDLPTPPPLDPLVGDLRGGVLEMISVASSDTVQLQSPVFKPIPNYIVGLVMGLVALGVLAIGLALAEII